MGIVNRVTSADSNPYSRIKAYERDEFGRLSGYLADLDSDGWTEQSYCADWAVYQVVSHIGSGARIGALRLKAWVGGGPAVTREVMQSVWGFFDGLEPSAMRAAYEQAREEYLRAEDETPDEAGLQEVDGFAGRRPLHAYQLARVWELSCHSWDVYVARDRSARLAAAAVALLAPSLDQINLPLDRDRGSTLHAKPIVFRLNESGARYALDPTAERPRVQPVSSDGDAPLVVTGADEGIVRFLSGRHFVPGTRSGLRVAKGSAQDLAAVRRAFR